MATLNGTDFRIDGEPIGNDDSYAVAAVDLPSGAVLSGVLADGTPFALTSSDGDHFTGTLQVSSDNYLLPRDILPLIAPTSPTGLYPGEKLTLEAGQNVGANFTAGWGSELTINGEKIGKNFEAVGAKVSLLDGAIDENMDVMFGSEFNMLGGAIGQGLQAHRGSVVNISGGTVSEISARSGSVVNVTGGTIGKYFDGNDAALISLEAGSELRVTGTDFFLDGIPLVGMEAGNSIVLEWDEPPGRDLSLSARLADGSPFTAYISNGSWSTPYDWQFDGPSTITLTMAPANAVVPEPSGFALFVAAGTIGAFWKCKRRLRIFVEIGHRLCDSCEPRTTLGMGMLYEWPAWPLHHSASADLPTFCFQSSASLSSTLPSRLPSARESLEPLSFFQMTLSAASTVPSRL